MDNKLLGYLCTHFFQIKRCENYAMSWFAMASDNLPRELEYRRHTRPVIVVAVRVADRVPVGAHNDDPVHRGTPELPRVDPEHVRARRQSF